MNISLLISPQIIIRALVVCGLFLLFSFSPLRAEDQTGISFDLSGIEAATIRLNDAGRAQFFVDDVAVKQISSAQFAVLRQNYETSVKKTDAKSIQKSHALIIAIARAGDVNALLYLHEQFETFPEQRNDVAEGLSYYAREQKLRDSDWRLLVRSLNVVEGKQAEEVIAALLRYRRRANKSQWVRQLILVGLALEEKKSTQAIKLLTHWTGRDISLPAQQNSEKLKLWQKWFANKYPQEPDATLAVDLKESKWKYQELRAILKKHHRDKPDLVIGRKVFGKASCIKCHRLGEEGEKIGPDLTNIGKKMQEKELLHATLFPSHFIPEEYPTTTIETKDGKSYTGMMGAVGPETLLILKLDGKKEFVNKKNVKNFLPNKKSAMPEKLIEGLTKEEIIQLFAYIRSFATDKSTKFHQTKP